MRTSSDAVGTRPSDQFDAVDASVSPSETHTFLSAGIARFATVTGTDTPSLAVLPQPTETVSVVSSRTAVSTSGFTWNVADVAPAGMTTGFSMG